MTVRSNLERFAFERTDPRPAGLAMAQSVEAFVGRALLSLIFIFSGLGKLLDVQGTLAYMEAQGLGTPQFFLFFAVVIEVLGGLSLISGTFARYGALLLFLYLIPVTFIFHPFWNFTGAEQANQMAHFLKNLAILGGLMLIVSFGAGRASLDAWLQRRVFTDDPESRRRVLRADPRR